MKFEGTKGNWNCIADENYSDMYQVICKPNSSTFGEQQYNAQLIATAPELLEALKGLIDLAEDLIGIDELNAWKNYDIAKQAIKKATE